MPARPLLVAVLAAALAAPIAAADAAAKPKPWKQPTFTAYGGDFPTGAGGWTGAPGACTFARTTDAFRKAPACAKWHVDVPSQFINGGWNWFAWFPKTAGTDITVYATLRFAVKVEGAAKPPSLKLKLVASTGSESGKVELLAYAPTAFDGEWHDIAVPLKDLVLGAAAFDRKKAWEIQFETWSEAAMKFDLYLDEIGFDK